MITEGTLEQPNDPVQPTAQEIIVYEQAHETRRRWESYIWSWGILVTALVSFMAALFTGPGRAVEQMLPAFAGLYSATLRKIALLLLSTFLGSILLNVYRARCLMKQLECTIQELHRRWGLNDLPVVPLELDKCRPILSSTKVSVLAHLLAFTMIAGITLYEVLFR